MATSSLKALTKVKLLANQRKSSLLQKELLVGNNLAAAFAKTSKTGSSSRVLNKTGSTSKLQQRRGTSLVGKASAKTKLQQLVQKQRSKTEKLAPEQGQNQGTKTGMGQKQGTRMGLRQRQGTRKGLDCKTHSKRRVSLITEIELGPGAMNLLKSLQADDANGNGSDGDSDGRASPEMDRVRNRGWARRTVGSTTATNKLAAGNQMKRSNTRSMRSVQESEDSEEDSMRSKGHDALGHVSSFKTRNRVLDIVSAMTMQKTSSTQTLEVAMRISKLPWAKKNLMDKVSE
jgi:hypothetical protein